MIHSISKLKHITDKQAGKYTELEFTRMIIFETLEIERLNYDNQMSKNQ